MKPLRAAPGLHFLWAAMRTFLQDLRFAFRLFSGSPGFALVAALTLALGIASTATVFTWIDSVLVHPFPGVSRADELSVLEMETPTAPNGGFSVSWLDHRDYREHLKLVSGLALERQAAFALGDANDARLVWGEIVSSDFFQTLGVRPILGGVFNSSPSADAPGAYPAVVIGERLWRSYFHADPSIVGKTVRLNRRQMTILGVVPADFTGVRPVMRLELWAPASMGADLGVMSRSEFTDRGDREFASVVVRRKPGVTNEQAMAEARAVASSLAAAYPKTNRGVSATILPPWRARSGVGELLLAPLRILMGVAVLLLLIVCANVGNLLLARSVARHREFGIRIAMGASRWRVARQLLTESLLLAAAASVLGILLLLWMQGSLVMLIPNIGLPLVESTNLNFRILAFTVLVCLASAVMSGLAPVLVCFSPDLSAVLKEGGLRSSPTAAARRTRASLVIAEVALATTALVGAGLFVSSFRNAQSIYPGLDTSHVLFGRFFIESTGYTGEQIQQFTLRLKRELESQAGVEAVAFSDFTPLSVTAGPWNTVKVDGYVPAAGESMAVNDALVTPGYLASVRIPVIQGRDFYETDDAKAPPVMIVNQAFARRFFHGANPVGRKVRIGGHILTVVGMAADSKYFSPAEPARPFTYIAFRQFYTGTRELYLFLRTGGDPLRAIPLLRRVVERVDPNASAFHAVPLAEYTRVALIGQTVAASLMSALGILCLLLAAVGIYSVMSYAVNQRTQEIGIRIAMGARSGNVIAMVARQGVGLTLAGLAVGSAAALAGTRFVAGMLFRVDPADPLVFAGAALFLLLVSLLATWIPALRATHIDPIRALRLE